MGKEVEDIEFDELMAEKRHKELSGLLKDVKKLLDKPTDNSTSEAIEKLATNLSKLLSEQKSLPITVNSPDVNVEINQEKVVNSLGKLSENLLSELKKFNERPIPVSFEIKTDNWNNLRTVNIRYESSSNLIFKK